MEDGGPSSSCPAAPNGLRGGSGDAGRMETVGVVRRTQTAMSGLGPTVLEPFPHQVAGQSLVFRYDANTICKSLISRELRVYQTLPELLKPYVPQYRGVVDIALNSPSTTQKQEEGKKEKDEDEDEEEEEEEERSRAGEVEKQTTDSSRMGGQEPEEEEEEEEEWGRKRGVKHPQTTQRLLEKVSKRQGHDNVYHFLLLENIVSGFQRPCVLDLKLGTRQHGDDAPSHKVLYQVHKCRNTTSALLGVRLCGMKVYQSATGKWVNVDKMEGRHMREDDFRKAMRHFLFNGRHIRRDLIPALLVKLRALKSAISDLSSFRFYSSSLLIVYDGWEPQSQCKNSTLLERCSPVSANNARGHEARNNVCCAIHERCKYDSTSDVNDRDEGKTQIVASVDSNLPGGRCVACHHFPLRGTQVPLKECFNFAQDQREETHHLDCAGALIRQAPSVWNGESVTTAPRSSASQNLHREAGHSDQGSEGNSPPHANRNCENSVVGSPGGGTPLCAKADKTCSNKGELDAEEMKAEQGAGPDTGKESEHLSREVMQCGECSRLVDVRMVDFAHTTHAGLGENVVVHQGPDQGCLLGLSTLIDVFTDMYDDTAHQEL